MGVVGCASAEALVAASRSDVEAFKAGAGAAAAWGLAVALEMFAALYLLFKAYRC